MAKYRIVKWHDHQHYKDRCPPWIKLHHSLLTSEIWVMGDDATRALTIASMLLAARNDANDGTFNGDPEYVRRFGYLNTEPNFKPLIDYGFIEMLQDASNPLSKCNTEQSRVEQSRVEDISNPKGLLVSSDTADCPHTEIIKLYAELLPELPQPRIWEGQRKKNLSSRWKWVLSDLKKRNEENTKEAGIDFFRRMFVYISKSDFLMGRSEKWSAELGWIVKAENFAKIIQGNYENKDNGG